MSDIWELFPYPTLRNKDFISGSVLPAHADCVSCPTRECVPKSESTPGVAQTCRYGLTFARIDVERVIVGLVASDTPSPSSRARRRYKSEPERRVKTAHIEASAKRAIALGPGVAFDFIKSKQEILNHLVRDPEMHRQLAEDLRRSFDQSFNQSHDFLQLVQLVKGHAEALLHEKRPDLDAEEAAELYPIEGAIYFSTQLMALKLNSLLYLQEINMAIGSEQTFRVHPFILKYVRIYNWQAKQKNLTLSVTGQAFSSVRLNSQAFGAVIQGILDNLVKYAPAGSAADVYFEESEDAVRVRFSSLGPRIEEAEKQRIFLPGVRGNAAKSSETSGQGIGLAAAKSVVDALNLLLSVEQNPHEDAKYARRYRTSFELVVPRTS